jgi:hypothetical protein
MTILEQTNHQTVFDIVGYGVCPRCKTERDLVQSKTIECSICGEPYQRDRWKHVSWRE